MHTMELKIVVNTVVRFFISPIDSKVQNLRKKSLLLFSTQRRFPRTSRTALAQEYVDIHRCNHVFLDFFESEGGWRGVAGEELRLEG